MRHYYLFYTILLVLVCPRFLAADNYVIINQVMYDTPLNEQVTYPPFSNGEYIELYNGSEEPVLLHGWELTGDGYTEQFHFPDTVIPSKGFLIVAYRHEDSPNFNMISFYSPLMNNLTIPIIYQDNITLKNYGETITLYNANHQTVDQIYYDGSSHSSKPDRLSADNPDGIPGRQYNSLHRTWVEFDTNGRVIPGTSQWKKDSVSFGICQLANPSFGEHNLTGNQPLPSGENYILSITPLDPATRVSISNGQPSVSSGVRTLTSMHYLDGLGREDEIIALGITPDKKDLVSITDYYGKRNISRQWLPVVMNTEGQRESIADVQQQAMTDYSDTYPYTEALYENSSRQRPIGQIRPGYTYHDHPAGHVYDMNSTNDQVRIFTVNNNGSLHSDGNYYDAATLYKNATSDEEGKVLITYTDILGRKVLVKYGDSETYYVYDNIGRLRYILPNLSSSKLNNGNYTIDNSTLKSIAYCYKYDSRGNVIYKRLPGCSEQLMVYDQLGQLVLMQDGNQRNAGKWTMCAYDSIGRTLYTAEIPSTRTHSDLISLFADKWQVEHYGNNPSHLSIAGTGYASTILGKNNLRLLTINYYDNYDYISKLPASMRPVVRFKQESGYGLQHENATGLLTGTRIYNLSDAEYTTTSYYYDAKGRIIQSRSARTAESRTIASMEYLFDGSVAQQLIEQEAEDNLVREHYRYTYDHAGRPIQTYYQLNNEAEIILSEFSYDSIGHLVRNLLHNKKDMIQYSYDMRNMLTETRNKHFSERLFYADSLSGMLQSAQKYHNGNIAAARLSQADSVYTFAYTYDTQNRLKHSDRMTDYSSIYSEHFTYDETGNISSLKRFNTNQPIDDLSYYYGSEGNQLLSIRDEGTATDKYNIIEYPDGGVQGDTTMHYDANGNLIYDADRGISVIRYNLLNLPDTIQFLNGNQIVNFYDATGRKYKSIAYIVPQTATTSHYEIEHYTFDIDTITFVVTENENNIVTCYTRTDTLAQRIYNSIGYNEEGNYYHYIQDHLGNICAVVHSTADTLIQSTLYYTSGVPMQQSFGRDRQPYLYNGKEFVEAHGYNTYDYGFRGYYATIGRFTSIDPLAEQTPWQSPYAYAGNRFVNAIDWMGLFGLSSYNLTGVNSSGVVVYHDNTGDRRVFLVGDDWEEGNPVTDGLLVGWEFLGIPYEVGTRCDYLCLGGKSIFSGEYGTGMPNEGKTYVYNNNAPSNDNNPNAFDGIAWYLNAKNFKDCNPFIWQGANRYYYNGTQLFGQGQYCFRNSYKKAVIRGAKGPWGVLGITASAVSLYFTIEDIRQNGFTISNTVEGIMAGAGTLGGIAALGVLGAGATTVAPYVITLVAIYGVADFGIYVCTNKSISDWLND